MSITENAAVTPHAPRRRPTLTITAGPLSAGKSSWVRSFRTNDNTTLCLIRDEVRAEIGGEGYLDGPVSPDVEETVTAYIQNQTISALTEGRDVYLDGCNNHPLTRNRWEALATENSAEFRLMFFNLSLEQIAALNNRRQTPHSMAKVESSFRYWDKQFQKITSRPQYQFMNSERALL